MKTALITGASRGIGRETALLLSKNGYTVFLNCVKNKEKAESIAREIVRDGNMCEIYVGSVSDPEFVSAMFNDIKKKYGHLDLLINNAAISKIGLLTDLTEEDLKEMIDVNLCGVIRCAREAAALMTKNHSGRIINISSMWGQVGASCEAVYSATKGGVDAFTRALGKELSISGISVNAVSFGVVDTDMNGGLTGEDRAELEAQIPAGRFAAPKEAAEMILKIAEAPMYLTGQVIRFDGGMI